MNKSLQLIKKHNIRQLKLLDETTNIKYKIEVNKKDYNRAYTGVHISILNS